jgi:hypothetical protein
MKNLNLQSYQNIKKLMENWKNEPFENKKSSNSIERGSNVNLLI